MQKPSYRRLREEDHQVIYRMSKAGKTQQEIAQALGLSQSTVSKEMTRNRGQRGYRPRQAQRKASERQEDKKKRSRVVAGELEAEVRKRLEMKHSPEQISLRLKAECIEVSHESIYQYIKEDKRQGGRTSQEPANQWQTSLSSSCQSRAYQNTQSHRYRKSS